MGIVFDDNKSQLRPNKSRAEQPKQLKSETPLLQLLKIYIYIMCIRRLCDESNQITKGIKLKVVFFFFCDVNRLIVLCI